MATKPTHATPMGAAMPAVGADELHQADVDAFIARNRDVLNESIRISRAEVARGIHSKRAVADIVAAGMKRHGATG